MLDARPPASRGRVGRRDRGLAKGVERDPVAAVADRVDPELPAVAARLERDGVEPLGRRDEEALPAGLVRIVLQQRGAAAAERPVGVALDGANGQEVGAAPDPRAPPEGLRQQGRLGRHRRVDPDRKLSARGQPLQSGERIGTVPGGILNLRQADPGTGARGREEAALPVARARAPASAA